MEIKFLLLFLSNRRVIVHINLIILIIQMMTKKANVKQPPYSNSRGNKNQIESPAYAVEVHLFLVTH